MPSGQNSAANLTRAGGDRYKDKRALIAVIREALEEGLTDAEIRKWSGLKPASEVSQARRRRMARQKAPAVYDGIIQGLTRGAGEPFESWVFGSDGLQRRQKGGVNFGGVMKFGTIKPQSLQVLACDVYGVQLAGRGIVPYQVQVQDNGWYNGEFMRFGTRGSDGVTRAWFYVEPASGLVERVMWQKQGGPAAGMRMKVKILDAFWVQLNGLSWDDLLNV